MTNIGNLNSLASVGVGVNLAFSIVPQVRTLARKIVHSNVEKRINELRPLFAEVRKDHADALAELTQTEDLFQSAERITGASTVAVSLLSGAALVTLLVHASIGPHQACDDAWSYGVLALGFGPMGVSMLVFAILLAAVWVRTTFLKWKYKTAIDVVRKMITSPVAATSPSDAPPPTGDTTAEPEQIGGPTPKHGPSATKKKGKKKGKKRR